MGSKYLFKGSILKKCGKIWKNCRFSGRLWPDWGNTARAAMAGLGSIGLKSIYFAGIAFFCDACAIKLSHICSVRKG